jgi:tetratricopeptide (TPR) repeat protein
MAGMGRDQRNGTRVWQKWRWPIMFVGSAVALVGIALPAVPVVRIISAILLGLIIGMAARTWRSRDTEDGTAGQEDGTVGQPVQVPSSTPTPSPIPAFVPPSDLPPPPDILLGRDDEIARMRAALHRPREGRCAVIVIHGAAGIGKTALATRFAYLVADEFPDGQLFGSDKRGELTTLRGFVEALRAPNDPRPSKEEAEVRSRYMDLTRDRRVLVILDDADNAGRLSALLPAGTGCVAVITSRHPVPGIDTDLALELLPLPEAASIDLLRSMVSSERISMTTEAARTIAVLAENNPLALRLTCTALSRRPHWDLDLVLKRMKKEARTSGGSRTLDLGYELLTTDEQRALCLLGLLNEEEAANFAPWMLAALLGEEHDEDIAWRITDRLVDARLIVRRSTDASGVATFQVLDLVHRYARDQLLAETDDADRWRSQEALRRSQEALRRARAARRIRSAESDLDDHLYDLKDRGELNRAMDVTLAALALAREHHNPPAESLALATLAELNAELGNITDAADLAEAALAFEHTRGTVRALRCRALINRRQRQIPEAIEDLGRALAALPAPDHEPAWSLGERIRTLRERAMTQAVGGAQLTAGLSDLDRAKDLLAPHPPRAHLLRPSLCWARGLVLDLADRHDDAQEVLAEGQHLAEELGQRWWQAWLAHALARLALETGDTARCRSEADQAIDLFAAMNDRYGTAHSRLLLGRAYLRDGRSDAAAAALEEAGETVRSCRDRHLEALILKALAEVRLAQYRSTGAGERLTEADEMLCSALAVFHDLGDPHEHTWAQMLLDDVRGAAVGAGEATTVANVANGLW